MERLRLERDHLAERLEFAKDKGLRPYPRPSYSKKEMTPDTSSESSIGANRSKERASANRREYISSYSSRPTKSASNNTPLGIPRLSSNLGIPRQDEEMDEGDNKRNSPGPAMLIPPGPSMAKPLASPPKAKWNMAQGYDDFFNEEDDESDDDLEIEDGFDQRERLRMTRAVHKAARDKGKGKEIPPAMSYDSHVSIHGKWASRRIVSMEDARALEEAVRKKDQYALGYLSYINSTGQVSTNPRSVGVEYLLRQYNSIAKEYAPALKKYKNALASYKKNVARGSTSSNQRPPAPQVPIRATLTERGHSTVDDDHYRSASPIYYEGPECPPPQEDDVQMSNPRDPPQSVGSDWARVTVRNWPRGMRIDPGHGHLPRHATAEDGDTLQSPFLPDVQAVRYLVELAPFRRHGVNATKLARQAWITTFLDLFSIPGLYAHIIHTTGFPLGNRTRERFPFITNNLLYLQVTTWIHDHGLHANDPTVGYLEDWANSCRTSSRSILTNGSWDAWPTNFEAVERAMSKELRSSCSICLSAPRPKCSPSKLGNRF